MGYSVIFGAGKIARGFVAHLLYLSGEGFVFVEKALNLVELLNEKRQYTVNILGAPEKNTVIKDVSALSFEDGNEAAAAIAKADAIFTAVGGKNLNEIVPLLVRGLETRFATGNNGYLNIITCENWKQPADLLLKGIAEQLGHQYLETFARKVGITEAVVMRSAIEADKESLKLDPLVVNVQDFWELPVDASRIKGILPPIKGIKSVESFEGFLERKFYTYNAANGTVSYLGYVKGYEKLADAAQDEDILQILSGVYDETGRALVAKHKYPLEEQMAFAKTSLKKLQDYTIVDYIERNARDPIRKLGPEDRLVGSARMVLDHGITPYNLAAAIAAAMYYDNPADPIALELKNIRETKGVDHILENICRIEADGKLGATIKQKISELKSRGWIKGDQP